jgi:hypothetical protein
MFINLNAITEGDYIQINKIDELLKVEKEENSDNLYVKYGQ